MRPRGRIIASSIVAQRLAVVYEVGFPHLPQQVSSTEDDSDGDDECAQRTPPSTFVRSTNVGTLERAY